MTDAFAHCKFIAFNEPARVMFEAVGLAGDLDEGCVELTTQKSARAFVDKLGELRYWERETVVDADARTTSFSLFALPPIGRPRARLRATLLCHQSSQVPRHARLRSGERLLRAAWQ